jgi:hypothetical protein
MQYLSVFVLLFFFDMAECSFFVDFKKKGKERGGSPFCMSEPIEGRRRKKNRSRPACLHSILRFACNGLRVTHWYLKFEFRTSASMHLELEHPWEG